MRGRERGKLRKTNYFNMEAGNKVGNENQSWGFREILLYRSDVGGPGFRHADLLGGLAGGSVLAAEVTRPACHGRDGSDRNHENRDGDKDEVTIALRRPAPLSGSRSGQFQHADDLW